jgi:hypothetical protein
LTIDNSSRSTEKGGGRKEEDGNSDFIFLFVSSDM